MGAARSQRPILHRLFLCSAFFELYVAYAPPPIPFLSHAQGLVCTHLFPIIAPLFLAFEGSLLNDLAAVGGKFLLDHSDSRLLECDDGAGPVEVAVKGA